MNILLIGSGGREHAFAWKLAQSEQCEELYIAPGNGGTAECGTNVAIAANDLQGIGEFCAKNAIDMVVVGPEDPLVLGIYDHFLQTKNLKHIHVIGPSKEGAQLEGSKAYAKEFMLANNIPTAAYQEFGVNDLEKGISYIDSQAPPIVLKADGLAAGKGVLICPTLEEAKASLKEMLSDGKFGKAGEKVVIEDFLSGIEFSVFVLTDGENYKILPVAKDYKRIGEGDTGLNTGGMGAITPVPFVTDEMMKKVEERVILPTIKGLKDRNITYKGFIYIGLIQVENEPFIIEYNCRMGDPETEVVIPRLNNDLVDLFKGVGTGTLAAHTIDMDERSYATVVMVSGGYPESYEKGKVISGANGIEDSIVFHAGTKYDGEDLVTSGGRVLTITSAAPSLKEALELSIANAEKISFDKKNYRKDIGFDVL